MSKTPLTLINMSDVVSVPVKWLWKPYIPLGKITIIQGDPGEGKKSSRRILIQGRRELVLEIIGVNIARLQDCNDCALQS